MSAINAVKKNKTINITRLVVDLIITQFPSFSVLAHQ